MRIVFCGTPEFAVPTLQAVAAAGHSVELVVTQPDRQSGRGLAITQPAVKQAALSMGIAPSLILQPEKIRNNPEFRAALEAIAPDAILVVAYGRIIPQWMLDLPRFGNINLHGSLLPKYRGAAPVQWAVANGETATGVTTMRLDAGLDTGDMLLRRELPIGPAQTAQELFPLLAEMGSALMVETLDGLARGTLSPVKQDDALATLAPILTREDARMDFTRPAPSLYNRWRGFQPWPGAYTSLRGKKLIVHAMRVAEAMPEAMPVPVAMGVTEAAHVPAAQPQLSAEPGVLLAVDGRMLVQCGGGTVLELLQVQLEGKKRLAASEFCSGYQLKPGERLG